MWLSYYKTVEVRLYITHKKLNANIISVRISFISLIITFKFRLISFKTSKIKKNVVPPLTTAVSGSPILQNGKLVGAVTHVFVNDPTKGYGIFAENMLNAANIPMAKAS